MNCEALVDGEPCSSCSSCLEITKGTSMDVIELDAASNNGVDAMRDLIGHAALGSPGRSKVYIVDEVHMLSRAASNALLKTLEEPPSHVTFVLATTDPQKVEATIRSRTQHLEFRLLSGETLDQLLRDVRDDAGLDLDNEVLSHAVRKGHGSARDALSALDQIAASGDDADVRPAISEVIEGLCEEDASRSLVALSSLHATGWGPQQLCIELVAELRQAFLLLMAPELADVTGAEREGLQGQATRLGLARTVRAIELLGRSQVEMREAPDPQVVLEVAVVRCGRGDLDADVAGLLERLARLERKVASMGAMSSHPGAVTKPAQPTHTSPPAVRSERTVTPAPAAGAATPAPASLTTDSDGGRPSLGAFRATTEAAPVSAETPPAHEGVPAAPSADVTPEIIHEDDQSPPPAPATVVTREALIAGWDDKVLSQLQGAKKAMYAAGRFVSYDAGVATLAVPTKPHRDKCLTSKALVEEAMAKAFGTKIILEIVVTGAEPTSMPSAPTGAEAAAASEAESRAEEDSIDLNDLVDAPQGVIGDVAASVILNAFPGAVEEDS
jgi:DNA polymerase-3 subunit gamma/tau